LIFLTGRWLTRLGWIGWQGTCIASIVLVLITTQRQSLAVESPLAVEDADQPSAVLTVGIGGTPPFLIREGDKYEGIVLDLWQQIAVINDFEYELVLQTNTQAALEAVSVGELDLLVGPFSITSERLQTVNFTRPFFVSSVGVLVPTKLPTLWSRMSSFFTTAALSSVTGLLVCLFLVGNAIWLAERKHNSEHFSREYWPGVGDGMWFALVTLTTVGYGDRTPTTPAGRFIASVWMLIALVAISSLIGGLASAFTLAFSDAPAGGITTPEDLRGARIAAVTGSTATIWAVEYGARVIEQPTLADAVALVTEERADGVVFDRPALEYFLFQNPEVDLRLADFTLSSENFGFVLPYDSPLTKPLDLTIVRLKEEGAIEVISNLWLKGTGNPESTPAD
jgi:polar amino acid transport system substrate-binding protein